MTTPKVSISRHSIEGQFDWRTMCELLKAELYQQVAELLLDAQATTDRSQNVMLTDVFSAAYYICLACEHCRAEVAWHEQAREEADRREHELSQLLYAIFTQFREQGVPELVKGQVQWLADPRARGEASERPPAELAETASLWQRIQSLLGWTSSAGLMAREKHVEPDEILSTSPTEEAEAPVAPPAEKAEIPFSSTADEIGELAPLYVVDAEALLAFATEKEKAEPGPPWLVVYCLGPFRVFQNDQLITEWNSLKGQSILKYLIMHEGKPIAKDILMDVFWPDVDPGDTRRNLHQAIYSLRQTLRRRQPDLQLVLFKKECYLLNSEIPIWLDFEEFEKHVQTGRQLEDAGRLAVAMTEYSVAEGLYQGDFLEEELYEDWPRLQREHLRNLYLDITDRLSAHYVQQREYTAAIALCQKILVRDNCREEAYRRLMQCYLGLGQRHLAIRQYQICVQALKEELDLPPSEETVALCQRITTGA
jgi:DNA-binding SARP family transcriptional activator